MRRSRQYLSWLIATNLLAIVFLVLSPASYGQSTAATLTGSVVDPSGAAVPAVQIDLENVNTGTRRHVNTNKEGYFVLPQLEPGRYSLQATRKGFAIIDIPEITLNTNDRRELQFKLKVCNNNETVTVDASAITVNTSDATVATVVDRQFVETLPLNGRSFQSLIMLTPGIVQTTAVGGNVGQFSVNGQRSNANNFSVDGVSANAGIVATAGGGAATALSQQLSGSTPGMSALGTTASMVSVDAMEEFKIQSSTYSAEFGRQPGGQIQLTTRSGTNFFHGSVFDYLRNDIFDARNRLNYAEAHGTSPAQVKPPLRMNDFGGTFGGPIQKDKTFFFFSYEGLRLRLPDTVSSYVPSLRLRQSAAPAFQTLLNAYPLPTGDETIKQVQNPKYPKDKTKTIPVPTGWAPFVASYSNPSSMNAYSLRIDHSVGSRLMLFGRYAETPSESLERQQMVLIGDVDSSRTLTLGATAIITPILTNEFRANYSRSRGQYHRSMDDFGGAVPVDPSVLLNGNTGYGTRLGSFSLILPGGSTSALQSGDFQDSYQRQFNIVDNLSWAFGSHQLKFGIDYRHLAPTYGPTAYYSIASVNSEAALGVGGGSPVLTSLNISRKQGVRPRYNNYSLYVQDTWKPFQRLTLDYGLRWELNPAPQDANGVEPVLVSGVTGDFKTGYDTSNTGLAPAGTPFYKTFYKAFAPRVGAAYQLRQTSGWETVIRGGFGVFYDLGSGQTLGSFTTYPFTVNKILTANSTTVIPYPVSAAQSAVPALPTSITLPISSNLYALNPDLTLPYTLQWNVALEQALGSKQTVSFSYVASAGRDLLTTQKLNNGYNGTMNQRPNPNFYVINFTTNAPTSDYHSFQIQFQRRMSKGLQVLANYTWAHSIDSVSDEISSGTLTRSSSDFDVRQNFSAAVVYDLPKFCGHKLWGESVGHVAKAITKDWSVDSTVYAQTGTPIDITAGSMYRADGSSVSVRPDVVEGVPFWIKDSSVPGGQRLNPDAFSLPEYAAGSKTAFARQGTLGRNAIRIPGLWEVNMSLGRKFAISERYKLQFRADAFNLFNHPAFGDYDGSFAPGKTTLGVPQETLNKSRGVLNSLFQMGGNRSLQLSLRLSF